MSSDSQDDDKNAPYRSARRAAHQRRAGRARPERRLKVRSELRDEPDVRKIAKAIIAIAQAEAERAAQADKGADGEGLESGERHA